MAKVIYKFPIQIHENFMTPGQHNGLRVALVEMPYGAEIKSVENQREELVCWAMVDPRQTETRMARFVLLATGAEMSFVAAENLDGDYRFVNTVMLHNGSFVLHVFAEKSDA